MFGFLAPLPHMKISASSVFYEAAIDALPKTEDTPEQSPNLMRAYTLLSLAASDLQAWFGNYHALVSVNCLHNEANWPRDRTIIGLGNINGWSYLQFVPRSLR